MVVEATVPNMCATDRCIAFALVTLLRVAGKGLPDRRLLRKGHAEGRMCSAAESGRTSIKAAALRAAAPAAHALGMRPWGADPARRAG
jgi:hypothetical protein